MENLKHCLIIDDDIDDQEIFLMCVKKVCADINCRMANNGVEAISLLTSETAYTPQYIFIDMNMPKMTGLECLKHLRKIDRLKDTRMFMYSTTSERRVVQESIDSGAEDFIMKPAKTLELKEKLAKIFGTVSQINSTHSL